MCCGPMVSILLRKVKGSTYNYLKTLFLLLNFSFPYAHTTTTQQPKNSFLKEMLMQAAVRDRGGEGTGLG